MKAPSWEPDDPVVQIIAPVDNWVLEQLARRLAAKLPYAVFVPWEPQATYRSSSIAYFVNYALYHGPSGLIDVGFFTHLDESQQFLERARRVDFCICMSKAYADWLRRQGLSTVAHIAMGFDAYRYRPRLVLGVVGRLDHPRKGKGLVKQLQQLSFVEIIVTGGNVPETQLRELYQRIDYVLIPSLVEGGPMSLLEGLSMGKPVIAPADVGMIPEFGETEHIRRYRAGNAKALIQVVTECYEEKLCRRRLVQNRTWDQWAADHHQVFMNLLRTRGLTFPKPANGFRFGMLGELEVPLDIDVEPLDAALDHAAGHLFYGRYGLVRDLLEEIAKKYPFTCKLLETIPQDEKAGPILLRSRPRALR